MPPKNHSHFDNDDSVTQTAAPRYGDGRNDSENQQHEDEVARAPHNYRLLTEESFESFPCAGKADKGAESLRSVTGNSRLNCCYFKTCEFDSRIRIEQVVPKIRLDPLLGWCVYECRRTPRLSHLLPKRAMLNMFNAFGELPNAAEYLVHPGATGLDGSFRTFTFSYLFYLFLELRFTD